MKKMMTLLSMIALAFVGTMIIGCSNKEYDIERPEQPEQPVNAENVITLTTTISLPDTDTKALDIDYGNKILSKTFAVGEQVALIYKKTNVTSDKVIYTLTEGDITNGGKTATLTFTVSNPNYEEAVTYVYPAAMAGSADVNYARLNTQDGTLASISSGLDLATYSGAWDGENLPTADLANQLAIIAYTLKNADGTSDLTSTITGMTISDGTNNYTVNRAAVAGPIYVAIRPTSGATINYTATDGTYYYTKSVTGKTYEAGQFYQLGLRMTLTPVTGHALFLSDIGEVVGSDGLAYPATAKGNLPGGVTAEGMVAYKDGKSGLVIAKADDGKNTWSGAKTTAAGHGPVVADYTWKLPSITDWNKILETYGYSWTGLNAALESAGCTGVVGENNGYWSSTKTEGVMNPDWYWYKKMSNGGEAESKYVTSSSSSYYVRACFYFGYDPNAFSVSPTTQVTFAPGNLKYDGSKWDFLSISWEYHGNDRNSQYFIWTDVFKNATISTVCDVVDGIANDLGSSWRGLSTEEWRYLMGYDQNTNPKVQSSRRAVDWHRYAVVTNTNVGSGLYLLLFPDGFQESDWVTSTMGTKPTVFEHNGTQSISYTADNFSAMQSAGIIILPPAGMWDSGSYSWYQYKQGEIGLYWSSTCADATGAMSFQVWSAQVKMEWNNKSNKCLPVRLVKNVE